MPSQYSSEQSLKLAKQQCDNMQIDLQIINIENAFNQLQNDLSPHFTNTTKDITEENIQARIRGTFLMAMANKHHRLVLATSNKSEL